jgi:hypothetical protein
VTHGDTKIITVEAFWMDIRVRLADDRQTIEFAVLTVKHG